MIFNEPFIVDESANGFVPRRGSYLFSQRDVQPPKGEAEVAFRRGSVLTAGIDSPLRRASSLAVEALQLSNLGKLHPLVTEIECISESSESSSPQSPVGPAKILMLHGEPDICSRSCHMCRLTYSSRVHSVRRLLQLQNSQNP